MKKINLKLFIIFLFINLSNYLYTQENFVNRIIIDGNQRIDEDTIYSYMKKTKGDKIPIDELNIIFKDLYATKLFSEIKFDIKKEKLFIRVTENPVINRIAIEGNKRIKDEDIISEIYIKPRDVLTKAKIKENLQRILTLYRASGRYAANVEPKVIYLEQNRVDVVFEIEEGPISNIEYIKFLGNKNFSDRKLKSQIMTKESRWWKILSSGGKYDPELLSFDKENLRRFYANEGFVDADITLALSEISIEKDKFFITIAVEEGDRYKIGDISADISINEVNSRQVRESINLKKGDWFNAKKLDDNIVRITENIMESGYPFVEVRPQLNRTENNSIDVNFLIQKGEKKYINKIIISGNTRTLDKVIRRKLRVADGDALNSSLVKRSRTLVQNLGHFSKVELKQLESEVGNNTYDLEVEVEETSTGSFSLGGGFSSANGPQATIGISENNLLGKSQKVRLNLVTSERQDRVDFSFTEPFFLNRDVALRTDAYTTVTQFLESNYDNERDGFNLGLGYNVGEYGRQRLGYRLEKRNVVAYSGASSSITSEAGETILSLIDITNIYDTTDNRMNPSDGWYTSNTISLAGLGGDKKYVKLSAKASNFDKIYNDKVVFSTSGNIGYVIGLDQNINISDRFFIGNNSFVGFQNSGIGPRDKTNDDALGGNFYYTLTPEFRFGVGLPEELGMKGRVFSTAGSLTTIDTTISNYYDDTSIRLTTGVGLLWESPFGPIRLDYTKAILKESYDKTETFSFNVGSLF